MRGMSAIKRIMRPMGQTHAVYHGAAARLPFLPEFEDAPQRTQRSTEAVKQHLGVNAAANPGLTPPAHSRWPPMDAGGSPMVSGTPCMEADCPPADIRRTQNGHAADIFGH